MGRELSTHTKHARFGYIFSESDGCLFANKDKANIAPDEDKALQLAGKVFLDLSPADLTKALQAGVLAEVNCAQQAH